MPLFAKAAVLLRGVPWTQTSADAPAPTLFEAVQEYGLKLEARSPGMVEMQRHFAKLRRAHRIHVCRLPCVFRSSMRTITLTLGVFYSSLASHAVGQPSASQTKFEVASVKPSAPESSGMFIRYLPGGGVRITGITLQNLISIAYGVRNFQVSGGPKWIDASRFDIDARLSSSDAARPTSTALTVEDQRQAAAALKSLLADRFQITLHPETREQSEFALVVAKGGPKLQESTDSASHIQKLRGSIKGQATSLQLLALNLSYELGSPVLDKTGLTGKYTFELKWDPGTLSAAQLSVASDPDGASIFTALQEQLGLRLESQKGPVKVLIVDHAEKPSEN